MTIKEKVSYLYSYIGKHYGEEYAEWLWEQTNECRSDDELADIADKYL